MALRTDAWAERHLENGDLTVDIMVYEAMLRQFDDVDLTLFEERSRHDPDAVRVLRVTGTITHETRHRPRPDSPFRTMVSVQDGGRASQVLRAMS